MTLGQFLAYAVLAIYLVYILYTAFSPAGRRRW
ncbi:hypothetical protein SEA_NANOSMITE_151 [Mycobacterium phage Nanosmite]|nr:hypothetical protein SEA_NANOSMITE_151 [Mycobacterium phage Nanosmite]